ncbi:MAG: hydroxymethylbilane synthase [Actinobacteria bacterium]|nr:MAG: hydroxymethylbilane synthase [Actinomycetota bacterium]
MIRLATRSSAQARTQAEVVATAITAATGQPTELVFVETLGDLKRDVPLHQIGGQGVFVKEVQQAVLDGQADLAVHSAKDLPSTQTDGLVVGAWCERRDARDALVGSTLVGLKHEATIATGSVRRRAQLVAVRPDFKFVDLRGNIQTRLNKIPNGGAIVMAVAALQVLGLVDQISEILDPDVFVPMIGQGCVAVECRIGDEQALVALASVDHGATRRALEMERAFLAELGAGCNMPVGAHLNQANIFTTFMATGDGPLDRHATYAQSIDGVVDQLQLARDCANRLRTQLA